MIKKIILISAFILLIVVAGLFYFTKNKQPIDKLSSVLENAKKIIGMDLNLSPEKIKWTSDGKELILSGKGCSYLDALNSRKISETFDNLCKFFQDSGFTNDSINTDVIDDNSTLKKFRKDEIVCNLTKKNNTNDTSSLSLACADINKLMFSFSSNLGTECKIASDCTVLADACKHERVCRNIKYEFYNDCKDPSQNVQDIDFTVSKCECANNVCIPKKSATPSPEPK